MLTSLDMLYIILAFCAVWLTVFICWFLYQVIRVTRKFSDALDATREQIRHVEHAIHGVRVKFEDGANYIRLISEYAQKFTAAFGKKKEKKDEE